MPTKKYSIKGPLAERLEEAAESEEMTTEDLIDYILRRYLDDLWVEDEGEQETEEPEES